MSTFVKSLKRLYDSGRITDVRIAELRTEGKISEEEYEYIINV